MGFSFFTRKNKKNKNNHGLKRNNRTSRRLVTTGTNMQANNFINQRLSNLNGREIRRQARSLSPNVQKRIHQKLYNMGM